MPFVLLYTIGSLFEFPPLNDSKAMSAGSKLPLVAVKPDTALLATLRVSGAAAGVKGRFQNTERNRIVTGLSYGTIVVDEATHKPVAVLDGRDGKSLKEWLQNNRHVRTVTRDRASAYAKAIEEVLPDCMQVADRFHIHQNLMEAVKKALGRTMPVTNPVPEKNNDHPDITQSKTSVTPSDENGEKKRKQEPKTGF